MIQNLMFSWLLVVLSGSAYASDCALLLFPEVQVDESTYSVEFAQSLVRRAFPAGLFPGTYPKKFSSARFPALDRTEVTAESALPGLHGGRISFVHAWYRGYVNGQLQESLARYSIVHWTDAGDTRYWIIEHPERGLIDSADIFYAAYNSDRSPQALESTQRIYLKTVAQPRAARLAMYLAALSAPKTLPVPQDRAIWIRPIVRPMLTHQICSGGVCSSVVRLRVVYTFLEKPGGYIRGENPVFHNFTVVTNNGKFVEIRGTSSRTDPLDKRLVNALEEIADQI